MFTGVFGRPPHDRDFQRQYARKTRAMPTQDRLGLDDFEPVDHFGGEAIEPDKQQSIDVADGHSLRRFAP